VIRGEPHIRPPTQIPVPVRSHSRGFARPRYQSRRATSSACNFRRTRESSVTIDVHGSLDRVKDVSSFRAALLRRHLEECVRLAHADDVPLLILPEDTCCRRCDCLPGKRPLQTRRTDQDLRSSVRPRRLTASCKSGCLPPLRLEQRNELRDFSCFSRLPASARRSRRPHVAPMAGDNVLFRALQAPLSELPGRDFGEQDTFSTALI
jgi:hypothetical protein